MDIWKKMKVVLGITDKFEIKLVWALAKNAEREKARHGIYVWIKDGRQNLSEVFNG